MHGYKHTVTSRRSLRPASTSSAGNEQKDHYRVVIMGAPGVGKTCIVSQFLYEKFLIEYKETVDELHRGEYNINGMPLTLDILDTAGSSEFPAMRRLSMTTGDAFILVYSVSDETSFEEVKKLREQIVLEKNDEMTPIVIVGNKIDSQAERQVMRETAETTVSIDWGNGYVEASAKDNVNIVGIFKELLAQAKVQYALSPAVRRRRESLPPSTEKGERHRLNKKNSCFIS